MHTHDTEGKLDGSIPWWIQLSAASKAPSHFEEEEAEPIKSNYLILSNEK
jgi:hypothetical protein